MKADTLLMKELNKNNVRKQLRIMGKATKPELAVQTGLSVVTVNSLIGELVKDGEVKRGECVPSNGGRPSTQYIYNENYKYAVIIYGHQSNNENLIQLLVVNLYGKCIERKKAYFSKVEVNSFDSWLTEIFEKYGEEERIGLIAFGLPGEEVNGIITINDYPAIVGKEFMKHYKEAYRVPVIFENDVNAAVSGYYFYGISEDVKHVVGMYFPRIYGPGAGIIINGEIYRGANNFAGEFARLPIAYSWEGLDYTDEKQVIAYIGQLLSILCCVLAPDCFVLYGDFWTTDIKKGLEKAVSELLKQQFQAKLVFQESLEEDFEQGMIKLALDEMEKQFLKRGEVLCL